MQSINGSVLDWMNFWKLSFRYSWIVDVYLLDNFFFHLIESISSADHMRDYVDPTHFQNLTVPRSNNRRELFLFDFAYFPLSLDSSVLQQICLSWFQTSISGCFLNFAISNNNIWGNNTNIWSYPYSRTKMMDPKDDIILFPNRTVNHGRQCQFNTSSVLSTFWNDFL